ncbi:exonuclease SbcCD subunit D [Candidatus Woesearchaeota archaeon]|nr:exonuclease SbcCD subunit D [Candidatus Woesearchaeota archaeon]
MKFAHLADVHLGGWREPKMRDVNTRSFITAIDRCLAEKVDFIILAGDLFNTSMPPIESLKVAVQKLKEARDKGVPIYIIPGSHDFSPSGKTILDVLEEAGLFTNVAKGDITEDGKLKLRFTVDTKTGVKLTGVLGKKGGLDRKYYEDIVREPLESEPGPKIFLFHCALQEVKPKELAEMDAMSVAFLPKGFDYYAGGHVHVVDRANLGTHNNIVYPGPVFPNNFAEIEKLRHGSFVLYDNGVVTHVPLQLHPTISITVSAEGKTPSETEQAVLEELKTKSLKDAIVTVRIAGTLKQGRPSDVNLNDLIQHCYDLGAYFVMKNSNALLSTEFEQVTLSTRSVDDIEDRLIAEHVGKSGVFPAEYERALLRDLMQSFAKEKDEGEKIADFEKRVKTDAQRILS